MENNIRILVIRHKQTFIGNPAIEVFLDGTKKADLKSGESCSIDTQAGEHKLEFKYSFRSTTLNADFTQNADINIEFNRGSGEIMASVCGADKKDQVYDWQNQPRENKFVYPDKRKTSPVVATILSILLVGLGQMINGQLIKGLLMLLGGIVLGAITGGVVSVVVWIISGIDAYMCANKLKQGKPIGRFSFFAC